MKKTDKKIEKALITALNKVCNKALDKVEGFEWLTHFVNYDNFPKSLLIVCVFKTNEALAQARESGLDGWLCALIQQELAAINISLADIGKHVQFETEENCQIENNGQWNKRFNTLH